MKRIKSPGGWTYPVSLQSDSSHVHLRPPTKEFSINSLIRTRSLLPFSCMRDNDLGKLDEPASSVGGRPRGSSLRGHNITYNTRLPMREELQNREWSLLTNVYLAGRKDLDWMSSGQQITSDSCSEHGLLIVVFHVVCSSCVLCVSFFWLLFLLMCF